MTVEVRWGSETPELFSARYHAPGGMRFLVVEPLPDGGWDWTAWGEGMERRSGVAASLGRAMQAAECAAACGGPSVVDLWAVRPRVPGGAGLNGGLRRAIG